MYVIVWEGGRGTRVCMCVCVCLSGGSIKEEDAEEKGGVSVSRNTASCSFWFTVK